MAASKSALSAGEILRDILTNDGEVSARVKKIYPVVVDSAELPYIVYRCSFFEQNPVKGCRGAATVGIELLCYTKDYTEGVELAEAVWDALDGAQYEKDGMVMRSCYLSDREEDWTGDAYAQRLVFTIRI